MTISFLRNESAFKKASAELLDAAFVGRANGRINADSLHAFLLRQERHWPSSDAVLSGAAGLVNYLNRLDGPPKLNRCQQALAHVFAGCQYQDLIEYWCSDLYRLFTGIVLAPPKRMEDGGSVIHPYPQELQRLQVLDSLKPFWETDNVSTSQRAFMPPMPPPAVFGLKRFGPHEIYRSWAPGRKGPLSNARITVVLTDGPNSYRGAVHWNWWGNPFQGSDFSIYTRDSDGWLYVTMDLRPHRPLPDRGPIIERLSAADVARDIENFVLTCSYDEEAAE